MPRKHVHRLGTAHRRNYDPELMERALEAVVERRLSFIQAATEFGVPKSTLYDKYRGLHSDKLGRPSSISINEEKLIACAILTAADFRIPFNENNLKNFVQNYLNRKGVRVNCFQDNRPGKDWCEYFLKRNPEITKRNSQNIKRCRAELQPEVIKDYFEHLRSTIDEVSPQCIINYDETNVTDDPGSEKCFVSRKTKHASKIMDFSKTSTSIMFAASADGTLLPPYIVYKSKYLYPDWIEGGPDGARYNRSNSGWFDADIFEDWFFQIALPYFRRIEGKKVVIGDNLGSHISYRVLKACEENNISFVLLPKNSTHICQPLDVAVFHPIKLAWRKTLTEWKRHNRGVVPKQEFPTLLKTMLNSCKEKMKENILSGFKATGISPYNAEIVLNKIQPRKYPLTAEQNHIRDSFSQIITDLTKVNDKIVPKRKQKIDVPAGKSLSSSDLMQDNISPIQSTSNIIDEETVRNEENAYAESENSFDDENIESETETEPTTFKITNICDISEGNFVVASFIYDKNTKKEVEKKFVGKILRLKKSTIEIKCMRQYKGKKNIFVFPDVEDVQLVKFAQLTHKLGTPSISRGLHNFQEDILQNLEN